MNNPIKNIALLTGAALFSIANLGAVETDPVGFVTLDAPDGVDSKFGIPMEQAAILATTADAVATGTITVTPDASAASNLHYIQFSDGALAGQWYQVISSSASSITVSEDIQTEGALAGDAFKVVPFWTLATLFSEGFPNSTDIFLAGAQVILNDVTATGINKSPPFNFAYHDGSSFLISAGWFDVNSPFDGVKDNEILSPDSFITVRNTSGSAFTLVVPGTVPTVPLSLAVVSDPSKQNDNLVYNPYPADLQLSLSSLIDVVDVSTDIFQPLSQVIVYDNITSINPSPSSNYAYHDGSSFLIEAGWFNVNSPFNGSQDTVTIPQGGAFLIRKGAGTPSGFWTATLPYSL